MAKDTLTDSSSDPIEPPPPTRLASQEYRVVSGRLPRPDSIGGYAIHAEIGRGGMGIVYRAYDERLKRQVAIKQLLTNDATPFELSRFRGEAELIAQLQHPNVIQIYDIGTHEGNPFLALEYADGGNLAQKIDRHGQPPRVAAKMASTIATAMHVAHEKGIIHRDLKPANVLLTASGVLKISDFGLAKKLGEGDGRTRTGDLMGTPCYMAPEQAGGQNREVGPAADVYAIGSIFYELLTGRPPFIGDDFFAVLDQVRSAEPVSPSRLVTRMPRDLSTICLKCLEKSPGRRYESAGELADDLRRWLDGEAIHARPVGRIERALRAIGKHPVAAGILTSLSLSVVALVIGGFAAREQSHRRALEQQFNLSLGALDAIRDQLLNDPKLKRQRGLEPLQHKLLGYYEQLVDLQEQAGWAHPEKLAEACEHLGALMAKNGNKAEALKAYQKANELYVALVEKASETDFRLNLAKTHLELGNLKRDLQTWEKAEADFFTSQRILTALRNGDPQQPVYRRELAEVSHNLGRLYGSRPNKQREAYEAYGEARQFRQTLCDSVPLNDDYKSDLARSHGFIGDVELDLGLMVKADASYWASHRIREDLAKRNPDILETRFQLARSFGNFGNYRTRLRMYDSAADSFGQAMEMQKKLIAEDNANTEYQSDLSYSHCRLAELKLLQSKPQEAAELMTRALSLYEELLTKDPTDASLQSNLAEAYLLEGLVRIDTDHIKAMTALVKARKLLEKLRLVRFDAVNLHVFASVLALVKELAGAAESATESEILDVLEQSIQSGYRRKHPEDFVRDRAFRSLATNGRFEALAKLYRDFPVPAGGP